MNPYVSIFVAVWLSLAIMIWFKRLPSHEGFKAFIECWDTKGGNIFLLFLGTMMGVSASLKLYVWIITMSSQKMIGTNDVYAATGLSWITGGITMGFASALFKTMTGTSSKPNEPPSKASEPASKPSEPEKSSATGAQN